ncbi:MAG: SDR family NAD(P)-dependent oxidoreductase [Betaproteobacteria bacterium]|nr:SDR family NAD(P)-dependent oxidoreductase [Betaproteobacteria bacterium]
MDIDVSGKIAIVTMSTSGIGLAVATRLAEAGAGAVIVNGRDAERGRRACAALRAIAPGVDARFIAADILDRVELRPTVRRRRRPLRGARLLRGNRCGAECA